MRQIMGRKFRRQHILMGFIADFYCSSAKLVVEVDGQIHESQVIRDSERDKVLTALGFTVLRFTNEQIENDLMKVLHQIRQRLEMV